MSTRLQSTTRWLRWLTPGLEIKRWLLLLMIAELVLVLGFAYILKAFYETATLPPQFFYITLQFLPHWARAIIFGTLGVALLVYSYVKLTQSVLGPFLPGNSTESIVDVIHAANPPDTFWALALPFKLFGKRYVFDHHQVQEILYSSLSPPLAREYHAALADALEALEIGVVEPHPNHFRSGRVVAVRGLKATSKKAV